MAGEYQLLNIWILIVFKFLLPVFDLIMTLYKDELFPAKFETQDPDMRNFQLS